MFQTKAPIPGRHLTVTPPPAPSRWHWTASVLCGFMKVAHQSHDVIHSLSNNLQWPLQYIQLHQSITSKRFFHQSLTLKQEAVFQLRAARFLRNVAHL